MSETLYDAYKAVEAQDLDRISCDCGGLFSRAGYCESCGNVNLIEVEDE